jgi:hypothetical protein
MLNTRQIALARLATREVQNIIGSTAIFCQYYDEMPENSELSRIEKKLAAMQTQADMLQRRLEKLIAPYEAIEVKEIY